MCVRAFVCGGLTCLFQFGLFGTLVTSGLERVYHGVGGIKTYQDV